MNARKLAKLKKEAEACRKSGGDRAGVRVAAADVLAMIRQLEKLQTEVAWYKDGNDQTVSDAMYL